jgi:hypothetical protein
VEGTPPCDAARIHRKKTKPTPRRLRDRNGDVRNLGALTRRVGASQPPRVPATGESQASCQMARSVRTPVRYFIVRKRASENWLSPHSDLIDETAHCSIGCRAGGQRRKSRDDADQTHRSRWCKGTSRLWLFTHVEKEKSNSPRISPAASFFRATVGSGMTGAGYPGAPASPGGPPAGRRAAGTVAPGGGYPPGRCASGGP